MNYDQSDRRVQRRALLDVRDKQRSKIIESSVHDRSRAIYRKKITD